MLYSDIVNHLKLRETEMTDVDLLYSWIYDQLVRKNSFHTEVIDYQEHQQWYWDNTINPMIVVSPESFISERMAA